MDLDAETRAMLDYATKLTVEPDAMEESDVQALKDAGLGEDKILAVALIVCLYAFMTRLTSGLGVEHRPGRLEQLEGWLTGPARAREWLLGDLAEK
jgi:alkylhydroperoxidase family enzyme